MARFHLFLLDYIFPLTKIEHLPPEVLKTVASFQQHLVHFEVVMLAWRCSLCKNKTRMSGFTTDTPFIEENRVKKQINQSEALK